MSTLYRKYRPQKFAETFGQNHVKITLQNEIQQGKAAHAYLFCGPRAVGKTTLARVMAKSVNCLDRKDGESEPCDKCEACNEIREGRNLDVIEIDAASHTGVDNVRENIIASARVAPAKNKFKVFIIDEVHMLSISAFNALLKIMEEPPANVVFILCTTEVHKVPATIISRCQRFDFKRISVEDIMKRLDFIVKEEKVKVDTKILESIARYSEGYMRDAISLLGQIISIGGKNITQEEADLVIPRSDINEIVNLIEMLAKKDASGGVNLINKLVDDGIDLKNFTNDLIEILRKLMIGKINPSLAISLGLDLGENLEIKVNKISNDLSVFQIINFIEVFNQARVKIKDSFILQLPLEMAVAELCLSRPAPVTPTPKLVPTSGAQNNSTQTTSAPVRPQGSLRADLEGIKAKWPEVLTKIKKHNHSLSFILRVCEPQGVEGDQVCVAFKYKFHKERVDNPEVKKIIEDVLADVYGARVSLAAIVDENIQAHGDAVEPVIASEDNIEKKEIEEKTDNSNIDNLLKNFGGKIIN